MLVIKLATADIRIKSQVCMARRRSELTATDPSAAITNRDSRIIVPRRYRGQTR